MVLSSFAFANLLGTVYTAGNVVFTPDGDSIISPVGNRIAVFDLVRNKSRTLPFEHRTNIARIALSPDGRKLISVDQDGKALFSNFKRATVLHHFNFKKGVNDIKFSPDGKYILVTHGFHVQVWKTPSVIAREFAPFVLHRTYTGHFDDVLSVQWSADSKCFITTSKDMTAKLYTLNPLKDFRPKTFSGHRDHVLAAYFSTDQKTIYTIARDGAVITWRSKHSDDSDESSDEDDDEEADSNSDSDSTKEDKEEEEDDEEEIVNQIAQTTWGVQERHYCHSTSTIKVTTVIYHSPSSLLIIGFNDGTFGLWEMPDFNNIHTLSISQERITSVAVNPSGEWLAFGASKLGQLLVWEWQSESYILKQQGHYYDMNTISFSPDSQNIATGGDDGKVKLWNATSGFCFVTFSDHSSSVSAVEFAKQGSVVFSASLDGTVRAYDLIRYRNFRTFTSPSPAQFATLAVDPSGEVVCAAGSGASETFDIYVWSTQTGKLLEVLSGHEAPVSALAFSPNGTQLASTSWDRTVRVWDMYGRKSSVEPFDLNSEGLSIAFRPDGKRLCVTTLDGQVMFWDIDNGTQTGLIDGRKDVSGGRKSDDRVTAANSSSGKSFTTISYTSDGSCVIAGGNSKYVCLYDVEEGVLLRRWQVSENLSLEGTQEFLDSRRLTEAGPIESIDDRGELDELEDRQQDFLPGVAGNSDKSKRRWRPEVRTKCIRFSPTGRVWAAASTEGLLIYSLDASAEAAASFDPFELEIDITPKSIIETSKNGQHSKALVMSFKLNETYLIRQVYEAVPPSSINLVVKSLPPMYVQQLARFISTQMQEGTSPHMEFHLRWTEACIRFHGRHMKDRQNELAPTMRGLVKGLADIQQNVSKLCDQNMYSLQYIIDQKKRNQQNSTTTRPSLLSAMQS